MSRTVLDARNQAIEDLHNRAVAGFTSTSNNSARPKLQINFGFLANAKTRARHPKNPAVE